MEKFGRDYYFGKKQSNYKDYEKIDAKKQFKTALKFLKDNPVDGPVLDVGCALGLFLKEASNHCTAVYGCDISEFAISRAKVHVPDADLRVLNVEEPLPYADDYFAFVTALDVLEHTSDYDLAFRNIAKKIRNNGHMVLSMPINEYPRRFAGFLDKDETHISVPREKALKETIHKGGMKVIRKSYFTPMPMHLRFPVLPVEVEMLLKKA